MAALETSESSPANMKILVRTREGISFLHSPSSERNLDDETAAQSVGVDATFPPVVADYMEFSPDGSLIALAGGAVEGVEIRSCTTEGDTAAVVRRITEIGRVQKMSWSSLGSYLVTWEKPEGDGARNLKVFEIGGDETVSMVAAFNLRKLTPMSWPAMQWTADESLCMRSVSNEIHVHEGKNIADGGVIGKIRAPNLASFSVSPGTSATHAAVFIPENKGRPAAVQIFNYPNSETPVARKAFYKAQDATLTWSPNGNAVLVYTHTDVDTTGDSYYGSTDLHLLHVSGDAAAVPLSKEGPISDAKWSPNGRQFVVIYGRMPAVITLFDLKCKAIFNFGGAAHRNTISWSPHGRFLVLAGWGNLAGDMDFWDVNKKKKMGRGNAHCTVSFGWSPDGRFFMTSTLAPRMNVDNGIKIFRYNGSGPIVDKRYEYLTAAQWRPSLPSVYPDRPQSPTRVNEAFDEGAGAADNAAAEVKVYRPRGATGSLSAMMRAERNAEVAGTHKVSSFVGNMPPGMATQEKESKSAAKNRARKERKKKGSAAAGQPPKKPEATPPAATAEEASPAAPVDKAKKLKKLNKNLKAIEDLKVKVEAGQKLNDDQKKKLGTEADVRAEIEQLSS
mmetsp:Transcript_23107/g.31609  ORF Transcript_23107/g.31609 Transcript_23107/m.31609 type:complete len:618 (-) Transcript_23107:422-2275(-)